MEKHKPVVHEKHESVDEDKLHSESPVARQDSVGAASPLVDEMDVDEEEEIIKEVNKEKAASPAPAPAPAPAQAMDAPPPLGESMDVDPLQEIVIPSRPLSPIVPSPRNVRDSSVLSEADSPLSSRHSIGSMPSAIVEMPEAEEDEEEEGDEDDGHLSETSTLTEPLSHMSDSEDESGREEHPLSSERKKRKSGRRSPGKPQDISPASKINVNSTAFRRGRRVLSPTSPMENEMEIDEPEGYFSGYSSRRHSPTEGSAAQPIQDAQTVQAKEDLSVGEEIAQSVESTNKAGDSKVSPKKPMKIKIPLKVKQSNQSPTSPQPSPTHADVARASPPAVTQPKPVSPTLLSEHKPYSPAKVVSPVLPPGPSHPEQPASIAGEVKSEEMAPIVASESMPEPVPPPKKRRIDLKQFMNSGTNPVADATSLTSALPMASDLPTTSTFDTSGTPVLERAAVLEVSALPTTATVPPPAPAEPINAPETGAPASPAKESEKSVPDVPWWQKSTSSLSGGLIGLKGSLLADALATKETEVIKAQASNTSHVSDAGAEGLPKIPSKIPSLPAPEAEIAPDQPSAEVKEEFHEAGRPDSESPVRQRPSFSGWEGLPPALDRKDLPPHVTDGNGFTSRSRHASTTPSPQFYNRQLSPTSPSQRIPPSGPRSAWSTRTESRESAQREVGSSSYRDWESRERDRERERERERDRDRDRDSDRERDRDREWPPRGPRNEGRGGRVVSGGSSTPARFPPAAPRGTPFTPRGGWEGGYRGRGRGGEPYRGGRGSSFGRGRSGPFVPRGGRGTL